MNAPYDLEKYFRERLDGMREDIEKLSIQMEHRFERIDKRLEVLEKHWIIMSTLGGVGMFIAGVGVTIFTKFVGK